MKPAEVDRWVRTMTNGWKVAGMEREDLEQELRIVAWSFRPEREDDRNYPALVRTAMRRRLLSLKRGEPSVGMASQRRTGVDPMRKSVSGPGGVAFTGDEGFIEDLGESRDNTMVAALRQDLAEAFRDMPPVVAQIAWLHGVLGYTWPQVGQAVGLTRGGASSRWWRARLVLAERLSLYREAVA